MKVSVIVPIYNVEKYLKRCIDSIINQSYNNLEIILVDDGSTDNSGKIADEYKKLDNRIKVIHQKNKGLPAARNSGLKIATGDYISFIDSDDKIDNNMIADFVKIIKKNNFPDIVTSDIYQYSHDNHKYSRVKNDSYIYNKIIYKEKIISNYLQALFGGDLGNIPSVCNKFYKHKFIIENNLYFDETLPRAGDFWYNIKAFQKAKNLFSIDKAYYHYYVIINSNIRKYRKGDFDYFIKTRKKLLKLANQLGFRLDNQTFNISFYNNINQFIFLTFKNNNLSQSYRILNRILKNKDFISIVKDANVTKPHLKMINYFLKNNFNSLVFFMYYLWFILNKMKRKV